MNRRAFALSAGAGILTAAIARSDDTGGEVGWSAAADAARAFDQLHALVISHKGDIAFADAFRGPQVSRPVNVKSVSKTIVAALTGAALDRGEIGGLDETLGSLAPELIPSAADPRVADITIEHLLTMRAGLERTSGPNYGNWVSSPNWIAHALSRPFVMPPGTQMQYSTGSFHVLGATLSRLAGRSLLDLARQRIGDPLEIEIPAWTRDPQGFYLGGNEMALSPLAMIRFGELYRRGGSWHETRVLSEDWVEASFVPRTRSRFSGLEYGYGWFLGELNGQRIAIARGYGGQLIGIVPSLDLTFAITSDPTRPARSGGYFGDLMDLVSGRIIPAAEAAG